MDEVRTVSGVIKKLKAYDKDCPITKSTLYRWIKCGELPCTRSGNRIYINMQELDEYLKGKKLTTNQNENMTGEIRKII